MTTYNTGNPIGSTDARDLYDNAQNFDNFSNGSAASYTDRLGVIRRSLAGIEATADGVLNGIGYQVPVTYASGISLTLTSQTVDYNGVVYAPLSSALPFTTSSWGADSAKFRAIQVTDADLITYTPAGAGAVATTVQAKLRELVSVKDFGAVGDNVTDDTPSFNSALTYCSTNSCDLLIPPGLYKITSQLSMRSGVTLIGTGRKAVFSPSQVFTGSWLMHYGSTGPDNALLNFYNVQYSGVQNLGIYCTGDRARSAIAIGSDNNPATKFLVFERLTLVNTDVGVRWGASNAFAPLEQCDDISFRDIQFITTNRGFVVNATNAADYSIIERVGFDNVVDTAFYLANPGFMDISKCAAGMQNTNAIMFVITGNSPDPVRISLCQSEGAPGSFLYCNATNDQGAIHLEANVINQKIEVTGITRFTSRNNYINSTISLTDYVRWKSQDDVWDYGAAQQVFTSGSVQFSAYALKDASGMYFKYLPKNFHIENGDATAGGYTGNVVVRAGIYAPAFAATGSYGAGEYVVPSVDNGYAYVCTVAGTAGAEPTWPTGAGATVTTGSVTFQRSDVSALVKGYGAIAS